MMLKEEEKAKVLSSDIRFLEKTLNKIDLEIESLINEFDLNALDILGSELIDKLSKLTYQDDNTLETVSLFKDVSSRVIRTTKGRVEAPYCGILQSIHKSYIDDSLLKEEYEEKLRNWFSLKTKELKEKLDHRNTALEVNQYVPVSYALASLALRCFHKNPNMKLRDVQFLTGIAISNGDIAELGTGEGKTLAGILPAYLHALRGKGVHVVTANSYLAKRDYEELNPIFYGLGLTCGFVPESVEDLARIEGIDYDVLTFEQRRKLEEKLKVIKQDAYKCDVTYGSKSSFAFDYLKDSTVTKKDDLLQREENPGFALIDEIDDALIDDAQCPYVLGGSLPVYRRNMTFSDLANVLNKPFDEVNEKVQEMGIILKRFDKVDYDKARNIAKSLYSIELIPEQALYQKRAQRFFESKVKKDIYVVEDGAFGLTASELYEVLTNDDREATYKNKDIQKIVREEVSRIKKESSIIYFPEKKEYKVNDKCYDEFLTYCYAAFQVNSIANRNQRLILDDTNYVSGQDYNIIDGRIVLTFDGTKRIIKDRSHLEFYDDYEKYMSLVSPEACGLLHYFEQAVVANLIMKSPEDYVVHDGKIKVIKNSRIQDGSSYTDGLHQALELKEHISNENSTSENHIIASVTQKDFYSRYDMFSGMTGTSSKKVFAEVFGKKTVCVPKNAFYNFYSFRGRKKKENSLEPVGVEKKDTVFAIGQTEKINLMIESIKKSQESEPMQPVLLVVSNPSEMGMVSLALSNAGVSHLILDAVTDKSKEAEIISKAGLPGSVIVSTEMAGRGTDIKLGGDRDIIIDIATERHIRNLESRAGKSLNFGPFEKHILRKKVENALLEYSKSTGKKILWTKKEEIDTRKQLEKVGLKVISSGYFNIDRIDRQLEGRTGRNGMIGICERFACPEDFEYLGIDEISYGKSIREYFVGFNVTSDGRIIIKQKDYDRLKEKVITTQRNNEGKISANITNTQELSKTATRIIEKYREKRRQIICDKIDFDIELQDMFEKTVDNLIMSYVTSGIVSSDDLLVSLANSDFTIDYKTFSLEVKSVLGINVDADAIIDSGINLLELRNALLNTVIENHRARRENDPKGQLERDRETLLLANDYAVSNISSILALSSNQKGLTSMSMGMENMADYTATMEFHRGFRQMQLESSKYALKKLMGVVLTKEESKELEERKAEIFGYRVARMTDDLGYSLEKPVSVENDGDRIEKFDTLSSKVEDKAERELNKVNKKAEKLEAKGKTDKASKLYDNLSVRTFKFVSSLDGSFDKLVLVKGQPSLKSNVSMGK